MIVGITGLIGSGKNTVANYLASQHNFKQVSFASTLKDIVSVIFDWDRQLLEGTTEESRKFRETVDEFWAKKLNTPNFTPRLALQYIGTDVFRNHFHQDIWVISLENKLKKASGNIVVTDCRFANEVKAIKNMNGITMRVERGPQPEWYQEAAAVQRNDTHMGWALSKYKLTQLNIHESEYSSVGLNYDFVIENNGTVEELYNKIDMILEK
jgi:hypothetical protein